MADRDSAGRFQPGHSKPGPGNPHARRVAALRSGLLAAVSDRDLAEVAVALLAKAREGDAVSARLLFEYTLGRPRATQDAMPLQLPPLNTANGIMQGTQSLADALVAGDVSPEAAQVMLATLAAARSSVELGEFAQRLQDLEDARTGRSQRHRDLFDKMVEASEGDPNAVLGGDDPRDLGDGFGVTKP